MSRCKQQRLVGIDSALTGTKVEFVLRASESRGHGVNLSQGPNAVGNLEFHSTGLSKQLRLVKRWKLKSNMSICHMPMHVPMPMLNIMEMNNG